MGIIHCSSCGKPTYPGVYCSCGDNNRWALPPAPITPKPSHPSSSSSGSSWGYSPKQEDPFSWNKQSSSSGASGGAGGGGAPMSDEAAEALGIGLFGILVAAGAVYAITTAVDFISDVWTSVSNRIEYAIAPDKIPVILQGTIFAANDAYETTYKMDPACVEENYCPAFSKIDHGLEIKTVTVGFFHGLYAEYTTKSKDVCLAQAFLKTKFPMGDVPEKSKLVIASSPNYRKAQEQVNRICSAWAATGLASCNDYVQTTCDGEDSYGIEISKLPTIQDEELCSMPDMQGYCGEFVLPSQKTPEQKAEPEKETPKAKTGVQHEDSSVDVSNASIGYFIVTADQLNLRIGPGTEHAVKDTLMNGSCVTVEQTERNGGGFVQVFADTTDKRFQRGFVSEKYLKPAPEGTTSANCFAMWVPG